MTRAELRQIVQTKLDEDPAQPYRYITDSAIHRALDIAQVMFCHLTLCFEKSTTLTFAESSPSLEFAASVTDFVAVLRVSESGRQIRPSSLHRFASRHSSWMGEPGVPMEYALVAANMMALNPPPSSSSVATVTLVYAATAPVLASDGQAPVIAVEDHESLAAGASAILRQLLLGGQVSEGAKDDFEFFFNALARRAEFVRNRHMAARYDTLPAGVTKEAVKAILKDIKA
jgi:hypothetical protein